MALAVAAGWLLLDQVTKWWAEGELVGDPIEVVWTLRLRLVTNSGASFSMGEGLGPYIGVVALAVVGVLLWTGRSIGSRFGAVGLGLVLGGALGNVLDRAFRSGDGFMDGAVIDFIDFQWWPVFNVADIGVVVGAIMLMLASLWEPEGPDLEEPELEEPDLGESELDGETRPDATDGERELERSVVRDGADQGADARVEVPSAPPDDLSIDRP